MKNYIYFFFLLIAASLKVSGQNAFDYQFKYVNESVDGVIDIYTAPPGGGLSHGIFVFNPSNWLMDPVTFGEGIFYDYANLSLKVDFTKTLKLGVDLVSANKTLISTDKSSQVFKGLSAETWELPLLSATSDGKIFIIKNRGSNDLTIETQGSDEIYETTNLSFTVINAGNWAIFIKSGEYWEMLQN